MGSKDSERSLISRLLNAGKSPKEEKQTLAESLKTQRERREQQQQATRFGSRVVGPRGYESNSAALLRGPSGTTEPSHVGIDAQGNVYAEYKQPGSNNVSGRNRIIFGSATDLDRTLNSDTLERTTHPGNGLRLRKQLPLAPGVSDKEVASFLDQTAAQRKGKKTL